MNCKGNYFIVLDFFVNYLLLLLLYDVTSLNVIMFSFTK